MIDIPVVDSPVVLNRLLLEVRALIGRGSSGNSAGILFLE